MKFIFLILILITGCNAETESLEKKEAVKISHRGYEENKLPGFIAAFNDGYGILETDVRLRGGKPVLLHDDVDCDDCSSLERLLMFAQGNSVILFIELKERAAIDLSLELISSYNVDVVLTSFSASDLVYINSVSNYPLGFITSKDYDLSKLPVIDYLIISQSNIDKCIEGIKCVAWTITNKEQYDKIKLSVDYVVEDKY